MENEFVDPLFREIDYQSQRNQGNVIKAGKAEVIGKTRIAVEENSLDGVKIILKKDADDSIKEIKFICSCGQTKSILLDYSEQ
jgi:hypothetical protein